MVDYARSGRMSIELWAKCISVNHREISGRELVVAWDRRRGRRKQSEEGRGGGEEARAWIGWRTIHGFWRWSRGKRRSHLNQRGGARGKEEGERVYSTCRPLVRNGTSIFHADRCDVRFIVNTFPAQQHRAGILSCSSTVSRLPMLRVDFTGKGEGGELLISYTTILGITSVVNRFVVNVALGYIDVNASMPDWKMFFKVYSELSLCNVYWRSLGVSLLSLRNDFACASSRIGVRFVCVGN